MASQRPSPRIVTDLPRLPPRPPNMHKGQAGRVVIVAGSRGMSGAAVLSGLGALRGGAGLVRVLTPAGVYPIVAAAEPCLMVAPLAETRAGAVGPAAVEEAAEALRWADVAAFGPGWGDSDGPLKFLARLPSLPEGRKPAVFDADALNAIARFSLADDWWPHRADVPTVITPHPGEMSRLLQAAGLPAGEGRDDDARLAMAHEYACYAGVTVVLKGHRTVVCTPEQAYVNTTGNPGMAAGGMGDVLTGLIAALLGQKLGAFAAACLGVWCHGRAADQLVQRVGPVGYLAREVADELPAALAHACRPTIGFR